MNQTDCSPQEITRHLLDLFQSVLKVEVGAEENLLTSGLVDSIGMMRIIAKIEQHYEMRVPPEDLLPANFRTVATAADYVGRRLTAS